MNCKHTQNIFIFLAAAIIALFAGCNSYPNKDDGGGSITGRYKLKGVTVIDPNRDTTIVLTTIAKDNVVLKTAKAKLGLDTLAYIPTPFTSDSVYGRMFTVASRYGAGNFQFVFADADILADSEIVVMPGTYTLTNITPPNRTVNGAEDVILDWSGALYAEAYVVSAVQRANRYTGHGFSQYATNGATAATVQRDAFYPTGGVLPDTGWYYVYVYALTGAPDSLLSRTALPVPLPSQLADDIAKTKVSGHLGAVRVLARDSVHVVAQP